VQRGATPADDPNAQRIARARQRIDEQWNRPLDMQELAAAVGLSYRHFRRLFLQFTGLPPNQYLLNLRINRAKRLLEESLTIEQVALRSGFTDPYYFSRVFKQKTGITPAKWRG
jgi:AraC-like DNA-binding protein